MPRVFYRCFLRKFIRVFFIFRGFVRFSFALFYKVASLKVLSTNDFDMETKVLDTKIFAQHNIVDLNSDIIFILFSHENPLQ